MPVKIIKPGMFTTIQDLGRTGYRGVGIGPGGAMDFFATSVANYLVNNKEKCPVLEMHFPAAEILFTEDALISITGANFEPRIDDAPALLWKPLPVKKGQKLSFKKFVTGARAYLGIYSGFAADSWLSSASTHTKVKAGGYQGRALLKEDILPVNEAAPLMTHRFFPDLGDLISPVYMTANVIRCIAGPEWDLLNQEAKDIFSRTQFSVTPQSDRMGYRIKSNEYALQNNFQLVSSPVDRGTIQLLPNGQVIVLMADHQTVGGYPRIASVIGADLPKLAQCIVHSKLQFELTDIEHAEEMIILLYQALESIRDTCNNYYAAH